MSTNLIKIDITAYGFLDFGAAKVEKVSEAIRDGFGRYLAEGRHGEMAYLARNVEKRFDPAALAERRDLREQVGEALRQLPPDAREILLLRELGGQSYDEIAATLDLDLGTVKSRIFSSLSVPFPIIPCRLEIRRSVCAIFAEETPRSGLPAASQAERISGRSSLLSSYKSWIA